MPDPHSQLVDTSPSVPPDMPAEQRIELWFALMHAAEDMLLANLRRTAKTEEELRQAVREWYRKEMEIRDFERYGIKPPEAEHGG